MATINVSNGDNVGAALSGTHRGDTIRVESGRYNVRRDLSVTLEGSTIECPSGQAVLDFGNSNGYTHDWECVGGTSTVRNLSFEGKRSGGSSGGHSVWAHSGAEIHFDGCRWPDGGGSSGGHPGPIGVYLRSQGGDREHRGTARFTDIYMAGFPNNGIYGSGPGAGGGRLIVEDSYFKNNNVASVRFGGNGSYVRNTVIEVDESQVPSLGAVNARGVWLHEGGSFTIEHCDFVFDSESGNPIVDYPGANGYDVTVRNNRVQQDGGAPAMSLDRNGSVSGHGNHVSGSGNLSTPGAGHTVACSGSGCQSPGDDGGSDISDTYKGHSKDSYFYCGDDTTAYWRWRNQEITTDRFAYITSQGQGTAQLQRSPCDSDDPDPPDDGNGDDDNGGETPDDGAQTAGVGLLGLGLVSAAIAREWRKRRS